jgi:hypothetical protein
LSQLAKDKCSPAVSLSTEIVHHPDGNILVAEIYRRKDIPHAVVRRKGREIKRREYYIRTVNGKRLVSDSIHKRIILLPPNIISFDSDYGFAVPRRKGL